MLLAGLSLLAPTGLLVCLVAPLPPVALVLVTRRQRSVAASIGLRPAPLRAVVPTAVASATACLALGLAAAQPVSTTTDSRVVRTRSEIVFLVDVSRSMLASASPGAPNRLARARSMVEKLRLAAPDVPAGISGLTDRALPYMFPTLDAEAFSATLAQSVRVDAPPPLWSVLVSVATSFAPLETIGRDGFFGNRATYRTCVLVTDGEARSTLGEPRSAGSRRCRLVVVRVGDGGDRIFDADGRPVASYRPEASAPETVARVVRTMRGVAFREGDLGSAAAAVRAATEQGPRATVGVKKTVRPLAPWLAGLALLLVVAIVVRRGRCLSLRRLPSVSAPHYDRSSCPRTTRWEPRTRRSSGAAVPPSTPGFRPPAR